MNNLSIAVIGGKEMDKYFSENSIEFPITSTYKTHSKQIEKIFYGKEISVNGSRFVFVNRYAIGLSEGKMVFKPNEIDYKTMMVGLYQSGIKYIISISKCGSLQKEWLPGTIALLRDCVDMVNRDITLDDLGSDVADMTEPFDKGLCDSIKQSAKEEKIKIENDAIYVLSVDGSRLETQSEIQLIRKMFSGKLVVGMTVSTEAHLAKLLGLKYAALSAVTNYAAGMREQITNSTIEGAFEKTMPKIAKLIFRAVTDFSHKGR